MKKLLLLAFLLPVMAISQESRKSFEFEGLERSYIEYVPSIYDGSVKVPLLISLHGLGDEIDNFKNVGFQQLSESENFIVLTPQAILDPTLGVTAWNSGASYFGIGLNQNINDVGFLKALIDSAASRYNIDAARIYVTGFSMGGFMSNRMACELNWRIAAIASVAGTIGNALDCKPGRAVPVAHFHGTNDQTVGYQNNDFGNDAEELMAFWVTNNEANVKVDTVNHPDKVADDITVTSYRHNSQFNEADVMFYKAEGAEHDWLFEPINDLSYTVKIWEFLSQQYHPKPSGLGQSALKLMNFKVYPNPASSTVNAILPASGLLKLYDIQGKLMFTTKVDNQLYSLDVSNYESGVYFLSLQSDTDRYTERIIIE